MNRQSSGFVLVMVLMVVSLLTTIAMGLAYRTRIALRLVETQAHEVQAYHLALGGLARAMVAVNQSEHNASGSAHLGWFTKTAMLEELFTELDLDDLRTFKLVTAIRDEQGCLHLNGQFADRLEFLLERETAACLLDWMDENPDTTGYEGADSDYYLRQDQAYAAKNTAVQHLRELLYIKGISLSVYRGSWLEQALIPLMDKSVYKTSIDIDHLLQYERIPGLVNMVTVYGEDRVNLNTAPPYVLAALGGLNMDVIEQILAYRSGADLQLGTEDDQVFTKAADMQLFGLTDVERHLLHDTSKFCFDSKFFRVYALVERDQKPYCLMATLDRTNTPQFIALERLL